KDKGIPTVEAINSPPMVGVPGQGSDPNTFGNVAPDAYLAGQLSAAAAIVNTNGNAQVVIMDTSEVSASPTIVKGMKDTLAKCSGCSIVQVTDTPLEQWSTALTGLAATIVRSHPQVNYLLPIYSDMGIFAAAGIQQAGAAGRVHIASFNGTPAAQALVKRGDIYAVNTAEDHDWIGWSVVDQAMRGMLGMEPAHPVAPIRYVGTADLKDVDTTSSRSLSLALFGDDYQEGYLKLWGLK
ncbi:MAG TPA: substrate-binding domain-containing protein, partial [Pusillimonas sp.]|uniref:substrate-binding domain-containing protein n=1 Tax=Pusillimonas sp. TaxID=3040095 RepID=UPI002BD0A1A1